jgi:hypothetical protein
MQRASAAPHLGFSEASETAAQRNVEAGTVHAAIAVEGQSRSKVENASYANYMCSRTRVVPRAAHSAAVKCNVRAVERSVNLRGAGHGSNS